MATGPSAPNYTPPAGTQVVASPVVYDYPPQLPGLITNPPAVAAPAVPGNGTAATNTTGVDVCAYVTGGTVSAIVINGGTITTTLTSGQLATVYVPAGQTISVSYTTAPTWVWQAA